MVARLALTPLACDRRCSNPHQALGRPDRLRCLQSCKEVQRTRSIAQTELGRGRQVSFSTAAAIITVLFDRSASAQSNAEEEHRRKWTYRGFKVDHSEAQNLPDIGSIEASVKHQIDIAVDCGAAPKIIEFFKSQEVTLKLGGGTGHFSVEKGVTIDAAVQPPQRPILLHELPPTRGFRGTYEIVEGTVDDLVLLTAIQRSTPETQASFPAMVSHSGRNNALFNALCAEARQLPPGLEMFIQRAHEVNKQFGEPTLEARVVKTAKQVFKYLEAGRTTLGQLRRLVQAGPGARPCPRPVPVRAACLAKGPEWTGVDILDCEWVGRRASRLVGQFRQTRKRAEQGKWIELVEKAAKGRNALWRWGSMARENSTPYGLGRYYL
jgi:hypothetical protein